MHLEQVEAGKIAWLAGRFTLLIGQAAEEEEGKGREGDVNRLHKVGKVSITTKRTRTQAGRLNWVAEDGKEPG